MLVLASGSPRRRQLLTAAGVPIGAVRPPHIPEAPAPGEGPTAFARRIARDKARAVDAPGCWVLAADTVVHVDGHILGKPDDDAHAIAMLRMLAGRWHRVSTAWCLRWHAADLRHAGDPGHAARPPGTPATLAGLRTSRVCFRPLSAGDMQRYVACGEGHDKAGGYAIQGQGMVLVERVVGSYTNVVGLPVSPVLRHLARVGILPSPPEHP